MITPTALEAQPEPWQRELARALDDPAELLRALRLSPDLLPGARRAASAFPLRVTRHYLSLIRPGDPDDPLLRQVLPLGEELEPMHGFVTDPVGDGPARQGDGVVQKYAGRALLILTGACAIHCRYCFRRHYPYAEDNGLRHWDAMLARLRALRDIDEVILSGGDPLTLSDRRLARLVAALEEIPHLRRLRIHARTPVVLPQRLTTALSDILGGNRLATSLVLHVNHPRELAAALEPGLKALRRSGVTLLNQSVLLRGVNDNADTLAELSASLFEFGVLPYYLHALDPVAGAAHFALPDEQAQTLHAELHRRLPGYLLPRLVREISGDAGKRPLSG